MSTRELKRAELERALGHIESAGAGILPVSDFEKRQSVRSAELRADVLVPLLQSVTSGILAGILVSLALGLQLGVIAGVVAAGIVWAWLLLEHNAQLWSVERSQPLSPMDTEVAAAPQRVVRVEVASDNGRALRWLDLELSEAKLREVARACLERGVAFSRPGLCGSQVLTQGEYSKLAGALLEAGLCVEVGGNKRQLNAGGRALLRALLE